MKERVKIFFHINSLKRIRWISLTVCRLKLTDPRTTFVFYPINSCCFFYITSWCVVFIFEVILNSVLSFRDRFDFAFIVFVHRSFYFYQPIKRNFIKYNKKSLSVIKFKRLKTVIIWCF